MAATSSGSATANIDLDAAPTAAATAASAATFPIKRTLLLFDDLDEPTAQVPRLDVSRLDDMVSTPAAAALPHPPSSSTLPLALTLLSYNVWFSDWAREDRLVAQFALLAHSGADVIGLQEVLPCYLEQLLRQSWVQEMYFLSHIRPSDMDPYGVLLLVRRALNPSRFFQLPLESVMERSLLVVEWDDPGSGKRLRVATAHLESMNNFASTRKAQLDAISTALSGDHVFFMGDFNLDPSYLENQQLLSLGFQDTWAVLHPELEGAVAYSSLPAICCFSRFSTFFCLQGLPCLTAGDRIE